MRTLTILLILLNSISLYSISPSRNTIVSISSGFNYSQNYSNLRNKLGIKTSQRYFHGTSSPKRFFETQVQFLYHMPISSNFDGVQYKYYGHSLGLGIWGFDILNELKDIDLIVIPGINWGTNKITTTSSISTSKYRNRFFAPKIKVEFRIFYKTLSFTIGADYQMDTSRKNWDHKEGENIHTLPNSKPHSILPYFSLGYRFK